ncbi:DNA adenine methylase [Pseudomonas mediterranea]|uniref:DNA adenine methylase n=1 Tax=Pseudomonas mediterranea TaxID=183795 RepID=UPI0009E8F35B|nr:DNA adenine methylase [Pseudomonas mediterranea]
MQLKSLGNLKGPLRYPGSKAAFAPIFFEVVRQLDMNFKNIVEPYCGSGAVSFYALQNNICDSALLVERDPLVYAFWYSVFNHTEELLDKVRSAKVDLDTWHYLQPLRELDSPCLSSIVDLGFAGLFFNRVNYSGILSAKPIGGLSQSSDYKIDCRFNKPDICRRIESLASLSGRVEVMFGDALDVIKRSDVYGVDSIYYVDPPYFDQGKRLYRHHYNISDHYELYEALADLSVPWFLSYDKHHVIELLYKHFSLVTFGFRYSSRMPKLVDELFITNHSNPEGKRIGSTEDWKIQSVERSEKLAEASRFVDVASGFAPR